MISASIISDSVSPEGKRITTFRLRYPKFIHGEFMTHRVISRNASSSRAIPVAKLIAEVRDDATRATFVHWGVEQKGMQSGEALSKKRVYSEKTKALMFSPQENAERIWASAASNAADSAKKMVDLGVHKSIVNRLLEPFSHINVVATATEWDNFFGLRLHKDAQPEMRVLAEEMWKARLASVPKPLILGQWHLPFLDKTDSSQHKAPVGKERMWGETMIKVSVARCARVSYLNNDAEPKRSSVEEDLALYDRLIAASPGHFSPAEHQATPDDAMHIIGGPLYKNRHEHGNFIGWRQYRKMIPNEACALLPEGY